MSPEKHAILDEALKRSALNRSMVTLKFDAELFDALMSLAENWRGPEELRYFFGYDDDGQMTWRIQMMRSEVPS